MTDLPRFAAEMQDRYTIERELGAGGMATVYLAHDVRHNRKVALKVLRPELAAILGGDRFLKEIQLTANLQHPHILPLHDSGESNGVVFYVMPYVEGESLRDRLNREKQLPVDDAVRIAREVASALDYAHRHGVVHRDIKPENILLHDGQALVADFGIALAVSTVGGGTRMTETGMSLGTPHYMAPEQAMGDREITPRADIYALGCVTYELLTGDPPFTGSTAQAIVARVVTETPRTLTMQRHTIPPNVEAAVLKALEKLPADRFATAAQFAEALGNADYIVSGTRAAAAPARPASRAGRVAALLPWALLLAVIGTGIWRWPRRAPVLVTRERVVVRSWGFVPGGLARNLAIAPDGRTVVFLDTVGIVRQLWSKVADRVEATPLAGTIGATGPTFSPDGEWIAFVADGKLKKVPRLGGSAVSVADSANSVVPAIAWLDNDTIAFNTGDYGMLAVHQDGGPTRVLHRRDSTQRGIISATGLPGGRGVLVGACAPGCPQVELRVIDLRSNRELVLSDEVIKGWHTADGHLVFVRQDGGVFRVPFDMDSLAFKGAPIPVLEGVRTITGRADMVLSANGLLLYAAGAASASGTPSEAVWVSREGAASPVDPGWSFVPAANFGFSLAPDGRRLAVAAHASGTDDIWVKELDHGPLTRLSFAGNNTRPEWTADGNSVLYISRARGFNEDVRARRADGTGAEVTLLDLDRAVYEVARLPDTSRFIIRLGNPPSRDIYLWRRGDSTASRLLAADGYQELAPALSPDGRWLAYASDESERYEVYVRPFPNVDAGRWQISRNGGNEPRWAHSGRELFYRDGAGGLVAVAVKPGANFATGEERVLFPTAGFQSDNSHPQYDVSRDDRRFLFVRSLAGPQAEGPTYLVQVTNWLDELRAMPARR